MFEYSKAYRQGEILIFRVKKLSSIGSAKLVKNGVIREGEKEGHEHKVEGEGQLSMFEEGDTGFLKAEDKVKITHPEHKSLDLPAGDYVVKVQKEATGKHKHQSVKD